MYACFRENRSRFVSLIFMLIFSGSEVSIWGEGHTRICVWKSEASSSEHERRREARSTKGISQKQCRDKRERFVQPSHPDGWESKRARSIEPQLYEQWVDYSAARTMYGTYNCTLIRNASRDCLLSGSNEKLCMLPVTGTFLPIYQQEKVGNSPFPSPIFYRSHILNERYEFLPLFSCDWNWNFYPVPGCGRNVWCT